MENTSSSEKLSNGKINSLIDKCTVKVTQIYQLDNSYYMVTDLVWNVDENRIDIICCPVTDQTSPIPIADAPSFSFPLKEFTRQFQLVAQRVTSNTIGAEGKARKLRNFSLAKLQGTICENYTVLGEK